MNTEYEYLSDDSLELLMAEVEKKELVSAPPELKEKVLEQIRKKEKSPRGEFYRYCFRVAVSVAAAVMLVFALPDLQQKKTVEQEWSGRLQQKEAENRTIFASEMYTKGIIDNYLNGTSIFASQEELGIFH